MNLDQHIKLVNEFAKENMVNLGMVADISIHTDLAKAHQILV